MSNKSTRIKQLQAANKYKISLSLYRYYRSIVKKIDITKKTILLYFNDGNTIKVERSYNLKQFIKELGDLFNIVICPNINVFDMFNKTKFPFETIIVNSDVETRILNHYIIHNNPNFYNTHKIIIMQTIRSFDLMRWLPSPLIFKKEILNNIYLTCKPHQYNNNQIFHVSIIRSETADFMNNLNSIGNIKQMPVYCYRPVSTLTKSDLYNKYNFNNSKQLVTIFLSFPCNGYRSELPNVMQQFIETYFLNNIYLVEKVVKTFEKLGYNVGFKIHPFPDITFRPLDFGKKYEHRIKTQIPPVSNLQMTKIIERFTFYDQCDFDDISVYTDLGVLLSRSTIAFNSYIDNIPMLVVSNREELIEKQFMYDLNYKWFKSLVYGKFVTIEDLEENTYDTLLSFINQYKDKPEFELYKNNPMFGNVWDFQIWKEYIIEVMEKPIVHSNYIIDSKLAKKYQSYKHPSHKLLPIPSIIEKYSSEYLAYKLDPNIRYCNSSICILKSILDVITDVPSQYEIPSQYKSFIDYFMNNHKIC